MMKRAAQFATPSILFIRTERCGFQIEKEYSNMGGISFMYTTFLIS